MSDKIDDLFAFGGHVMKIGMEPTDLYPNRPEMARFVGNFEGNEVLLIRRRPGLYALTVSGPCDPIPGNGNCTPGPDHEGEKSYLFSRGFRAKDDEAAIAKIPTLLMGWVERNETYWHSLRFKLTFDLAMETAQATGLIDKEG